MTDKENRVDLVIEEKLIHDCSKEAVKLGINLDEFHKILRPIVKYCTKVLSVSVFSAVLHLNNKLRNQLRQGRHGF